jgi:hypothetical protein
MFHVLNSLKRFFSKETSSNNNSEVKGDGWISDPVQNWTIYLDPHHKVRVGPQYSLI